MPSLDLSSFTGPAITVALALAAALVASRVVSILMRRLERRLAHSEDAMREDRKRAATVASILRVSAIVAIWVIAVITGLSEAGIRIGPLLAAAGIGGIAIGFGAQAFVKDVISGFFVIAEGQYDVGDVIEIGGVSGLVEQVGIRATVLRDLHGRRHVVPNGEIRVTTNHTKEFSRYLVDLPVPYGADVEQVTQLVREEAEQMRVEAGWRDSITSPVEMLGIEEYAESAMMLRFFVTTKPRRQWDVGRELRRRIAERMDAEEIGIPFPHREVIVRSESSQNGAGSSSSATQHEVEHAVGAASD